MGNNVNITLHVQQLPAGYAVCSGAREFQQTRVCSLHNMRNLKFERSRFIHATKQRCDQRFLEGTLWNGNRLCIYEEELLYSPCINERKLTKENIEYRGPRILPALRFSSPERENMCFLAYHIIPPIQISLFLALIPQEGHDARPSVLLLTRGHIPIAVVLIHGLSCLG